MAQSKMCEVANRKHENPDGEQAVARVRMGWDNRSTGERDNEEVDVCSICLESKKGEFTQGTTGKWGPVNPSFRVRKRY